MLVKWKIRDFTVLGLAFQNVSRGWWSELCKLVYFWCTTNVNKYVGCLDLAPNSVYGFVEVNVKYLIFTSVFLVIYNRCKRVSGCIRVCKFNKLIRVGWFWSEQLDIGLPTLLHKSVLCLYLRIGWIIFYTPGKSLRTWEWVLRNWRNQDYSFAGLLRQIYLWSSRLFVFIWKREQEP